MQIVSLGDCRSGIIIIYLIGDYIHSCFLWLMKYDLLIFNPL